MATIANPDGDGRIDVVVLDRESHYDTNMVQVQSTDDDEYLHDQSGNPPWLFAEDVEGVDDE